MTKIKQKTILDIVNKAYYFADISKTAQAPFNLVKIENSHSGLTATCSNLGVVANFVGDSVIQDEFAFTVNAQRFYEVIKNWSASEEIDFQITDSKVTLKAKNKRVTIPTVEDEGYWQGRGPSPLNGFVLPYQEFKKYFESSAICSSVSAHDITHRCLLIESSAEGKLLLASHEGFRMSSAMVDAVAVSGSFRVLVDATMAKTMMRVFDSSEDVHVGVSEARVDFFNSKVWVGLSTIPAKYPDISRVRAMRYPCVYEINPEDLITVSKSILSVIRNTDRPRNAKLSISKDAIMFYAATESGDIEDSIPIVSGSGETIEEMKGCDIVYLSDPVSMFKQLSFETGPDKKHGYIFTTKELPGWIYHLLPTR